MTRPRLPLRLSEVVAVVAALCLGYLIISRFPLDRADDSPFTRSVGRSQVAHLSYADVKVLDVRAAHYLGPLTSSTLVSPAGVFLVVTTELTATREPTSFQTARLVDRKGRFYQPSDKSSCPGAGFSAITVQTRIPTYVMYCFDVPPDVLTQLHLQVARGGNLMKTTRHDDLADVDLAITAGQAASMARTKDAYDVVAQSDQPFTLSTVTVSEPTS